MGLLVNQMLLGSNRLCLPAKTLRFKFLNSSYTPTTGSSTTDTSSIGTWTAVDSSNGIWDWYYNNSDWGGTSKKFTLNYSNNGVSAKILAGNLDGVTSTQRLFWGSSSLLNDGLISVNGIYNTSSLLDMSSMFEYCAGLTDICYFNTANVTSWYFTFSNCRALKSIPLFNTKNVQNFNSALKECHVLTHIPAFDFSACTNANGIFRNSYMIDNAKDIFNRICVSPSGLNGGYNNSSFSSTGSSSGNDERSVIPQFIGGTMGYNIVEDTSGSITSTSMTLTRDIHPGDYLTIRMQRNSSDSSGTVSFNITNSTSADSKILTGSSTSATTSGNKSSITYIQYYLGYEASHTNSISITFTHNCAHNPTYGIEIGRYSY